MWPIAISFIAQALPVIPSLVTDIENLFRGKPKAGAQKWMAIEQALSGPISEVAQQIAAVAPAGSSAEEISAAVAIYTKAVNDATVALANSLKIFPHTGQLAAGADAPPAK